MIPAHLHILRHSLGLDDNGQGNQYRNHFCTHPHSPDGLACLALVRSGHMKDHGAIALTGGMNLFTVTPTGFAIAVPPPEPPHLSGTRRQTPQGQGTLPAIHGLWRLVQKLPRVPHLGRPARTRMELMSDEYKATIGRRRTGRTGRMIADARQAA